MIHTRILRAAFLLTLTVPLSGLLGCKPDNAVRHSSEIDLEVAAKQARARAASKPLSSEESLQQNDGRPVLACFGDSLTAGYGADPGVSYPDILQTLLDQNGYRYRVVNLGVSGDTTKDGLARVDRVLALHPAIVVVEFGGNDGLRGLPITTTRANLENIIARLVPTRTQVALAGITLPPQYGTAGYIKEFDQTYPTLADKYHLPFLPFLLKDAYGVPGDMQPDGIHATAKGNRQVAKNVYELIQPLLKK